MVFLAVLALIWALVVGGGGLIWIFTGNFFTGLFFLAIGLGPVLLVRRMGKQKAAKLAAIHLEMLSVAGVAAGTGCDHSEGDTGIAVNKAAKTLTLLSKGKWKTYPFDAVRKWETNIEQPGNVVGVGVQASIAAGAANVAAANRAEANTGLFVTVKDVEFPKWRIAMANETTQARWMEFLRQEINEDR